MTQQTEFYRINQEKMIVQGVFYVNGRRVWRKLCSFDEAEFLPSKRRRSEKQRSTFLAALYADMEKQLGVDGPKKRRATPIKETFRFRHRI